MTSQTAKPKAQPPAPRKPSSTETAAALKSKSTVITTKDQDAFEAEAREFAAACGWDGEPHWVLNDIQVSDARGYLRKIFHELHVAALNPGRVAPSADDVCEHLNITDEDTCAVVQGRLDTILERERGKPTS